MSIAQLFRRPVATSCELETHCFTEAVHAVDREGGWIRGVKVLGRVSENGREYLPSAMQDAARLYEGCEVNIDHPDPKDATRNRGVLEGWGKLTNIVVREDGVYGDLRYLREHPHTPVLLERIDGGFGIGLSHNAEGRGRREKGKLLVENITRVRSVDLVTRPATNRNLFESAEDTPMRMTLGELAAKLKAQPGAWELVEMVGGDPALAAMPVEMPAEGESEDAIMLAFKDAIGTVFADKSLDLKATIKKMTDLAKAYDKLVNGEAKPAAPAESEEAAAEESAKPAPPAGDPLMEQFAQRLEKAEKANALLRVMLEYGVTRESLGAAKLELLEAAADEAAMRKLIESWPTAYRAQPGPGRRQTAEGKPQLTLADLGRR